MAAVPGCVHVEEFTSEDAAYRVASAIEQPCRSRDWEFINRRVIEHCQRLGRTEELTEEQLRKAGV
jgi:hypothetical protein